MDGEQQPVEKSQAATDHGSVEMPRATAAPLVLAAGIVLLAAGFVFGLAMSFVGCVVLFVGLGSWVASLATSRGHFHEPLVDAAERPHSVPGSLGTVERLATGKPGYRVQLPEKVHPISAGIKGGLIGGLVLPIPALSYGLLSGHGIWFPVNLLAGMALPGVDQLSMVELEKFNFSFLIAALCIHAAMSLTAGLAYGVLLPMLPAIPKPVAWGGLLMPILWTATSYVALMRMNSVVTREVDWPSFAFSQFVFGVATAAMVMRLHNRRRPWPGIIGGGVGGALMIIPAIFWAWLTGHSIWYSANVLSAMLVSQPGEITVSDLQQFHGDWLGYAVVLHVATCFAFGVALSLLLPKLPKIPGPMAWGALLMPVVWTGLSYSLMGVVNPILQQHVNWPWFVVSQFIFGVVASIVVVRSEEIALPPVGHGPPVESSGGQR